jgi:site-specific DNA-methyltransferase (adenine-specific)
VTWDLRLGDWREVLADVECDALITDPPYGARTHQGHNRVLRRIPGSTDRRVECADDATRSLIDYSHMSDDEAGKFCAEWHRRVRGWIVILTSHDLYRPMRAALESAGRYVFHPVPVVIPGMTVRMCGDGPSSWAVWMLVARPKAKEFSSWGALPGAYVIRKEGGQTPTIAGAKPISLMIGLVRDYTRPGDFVCDPCTGTGTTLLAAEMLGRNSVGAEIDADTHAMAVKRLTGAREQTELAL